MVGVCLHVWGSKGGCECGWAWQQQEAQGEGRPPGVRVGAPALPVRWDESVDARGGSALGPAGAQEEAGASPSALAPLYSHRRVLGVIGIMHCPHVADMGQALAQFEQRCK